MTLETLEFHRHHDHLGRWNPGQPSRCARTNLLNDFGDRYNDKMVIGIRTAHPYHITYIYIYTHDMQYTTTRLQYADYSLVVLTDHSLGTTRS